MYAPWKVPYIFDESDSIPRIPTLQKNPELKPYSYDYIEGDIPEFIFKFAVNLSSLITSKPKLESATTNLESVTAKPESATTKLESVTTSLVTTELKSVTTKLENVTIKDDHENENVTALSKVFKLLCSCKGQLISEWLFGVFNFPKDQRKKLMNFCPKIQKVVKSDN